MSAMVVLLKPYAAQLTKLQGDSTTASPSAAAASNGAGANLPAADPPAVEALA